MAGGNLAGVGVDHQFRLIGRTGLGNPSDWTAWMESASSRRIHRGRDLALDQDRDAFALLDRIRNRNGAQEGLGVRMLGRVIDGHPIGNLHDLAQVHDRHPIREVSNHRQIMGDENVGQAESLLQILKQVDDLRLNRHIEGGHRLITHNHAGIESQRPGDSDALPLAPGKLVRIAVGEAGIEPHDVQQLLDSLTPFRTIIKDYFLICESYFKAIRDAPPSQIETLDMSRRGVHNEGSTLLQERLKDKIETDFNTARRLFTLLCVLHLKG